MRRGFTLVEGAVAVALMAVVLVASAVTLGLGRSDRATWETRLDDIYMVLNGLERMRREIEVARVVGAPVLSNRPQEHREYLSVVDAAGRVVVYSVVAGQLVAETFGTQPVETRVIIPRIDRVVFSFREDNESIRFQLFLGGVTMICTAQPANDLQPASMSFGDTYGL